MSSRETKTDRDTTAKTNGKAPSPDAAGDTQVPTQEALLKPLYDDDAERAILGAAIVSEGVLDYLAAGDRETRPLRAEHFFDETHREIYRALRSVGDRFPDGGVDRIALVDELRRSRSLDAIGGKEYVLELVEGIRSAANVKTHVGIVQRCAGMREVQQVVVDARLAASDRARDPHEVQAEVYARLDALGLEPDGVGPVLAADAVGEVLAAFQEAYEAGGRVAGVPTGLKDLDAILRGLKPGTMNLLAGRPGDGKTALAGNVIWHATGAGDDRGGAPGEVRGAPEDADPVLFFSLEMPKEQVISRFVASLSGVPVERLDAGEITDKEWPRVVQAVADVSRRQIWVDDSQGLTVAEMHARARRTSQRLRARGKRLSLMVVDYLQLVKVDRVRPTRNDEVSAISRDLKGMAGTLGVPLLVLSQLSRAVMSRADKRPQLEDLRDSGSLEQDAFSVTMIFHADEDSDDRGTAELLVRKNRNGRTGMARAAWMGQRLQFKDLARPGQVAGAARPDGS